MRQHDREDQDDGDDVEDDADPNDGMEEEIALDAVTAWLEIEGDDDLAQVQREALVEIAQAALAQKERREARERAAHRPVRAEERAEAERREAAVRARRAQRAVEEVRAREVEERRELARRAERDATRRREAEVRAQSAAQAKRSVVRAVDRPDPQPPRVGAQRQAVSAAASPVVAPSVARTVTPVPFTPPAASAPSAPTVSPAIPAPPILVEPAAIERLDLGLVGDDSGNRDATTAANREVLASASVAEPLVAQVVVAPASDDGLPALTGADLAAWRDRLGLTQQAAADRLAVGQGTVSKGESRSQSILGPTVRRALAAALGCSPPR